MNCLGCGKCCEVIDFILILPSQMEDIVKIIPNAKSLVTKIGDLYFIEKSPCPFYDLESKTCKIYSIRPYICRIYPIVNDENNYLDLAYSSIYTTIKPDFIYGVGIDLMCNKCIEFSPLDYDLYRQRMFEYYQACCKYAEKTSYDYFIANAISITLYQKKHHKAVFCDGKFFTITMEIINFLKIIKTKEGREMIEKARNSAVDKESFLKVMKVLKNNLNNITANKPMKHIKKTIADLDEIFA